MAESSIQDAVIQSQSVGDATPSDVPATTPQSITVPGDAGEKVAGNENGVHLITQSSAQEEHSLEDGTARSDTDTSRAEGSNGDAKSADAHPVRKFATTKPISFAKYSVPKVIAANAAKVSVEKGRLGCHLLCAKPRLTV